MKKIVKWKCDVCGTVYDREEDANACESRHNVRLFDPDLNPELDAKCVKCGWKGKIEDLVPGSDRRIRCPKCGVLAETLTLAVERRLVKDDEK